MNKMSFNQLKKEDVEQSAWNLSQYIINQIGNLLLTASSKFRKGDIQGSYWDVEEIRILIHSDLSSIEKEKLNDYETRIGKLFSLTKLTVKVDKQELAEQIKKTVAQNKHIHYQEVKEYRMYMMELLGKYGYSVSKKENAAKIF